MKTLYFDLVGGIAGDMTVAALLDLGVSFGVLKKELAKLPVRGYSLKMSTVTRGHGKAKKFDVRVLNNKNYSYRQILDVIKKSGLSEGAKRRAFRVYELLAKSEEKVHGHIHRDMHFDEIGDIDSLIDIVGTAVCLDELGAEEILYSIVPVNPFLAPATREMLTGKRIFFTQGNFENITPTGIAILSALGRQTEGRLRTAFEMGRFGTGAGTMDPADQDNVVRISEIKKPLRYEADSVSVLEVNIDDMNPQFFEFLFEKLLAEGALDVFLTNISMKKSRPAFLLTVLSKPGHFDRMAAIIFSETSTIGMRFYQADRLKLARESRVVKWRGRQAHVKFCVGPDGKTRIQPEYEDCKALAGSLGLSIADVCQELKKEAEKKWPSRV